MPRPGHAPAAADAGPGRTPARRSPGTGLNSIRWRFTLSSAALTVLGPAARDLALDPARLIGPAACGWLGLVTAMAAAATHWMASRLTGLIDALRRSTEAIAEGDLHAPVEVDCACEVGGLATSFRKMKTRLNEQVLRINALAFTDAITGLPNRRVVDHLLRYALAPERAADFRAAVVFIDLDGFKRINDTLGHAGGDELLRLASRRLLRRGLDSDLDGIDTCMDAFGNLCDRMPQGLVFARFSGDEFVAILPGVTCRDALARVGERLVGALSRPFKVGGQEVSVGASVGIAVTPDDTGDAAELLAFADLAMYSAKQAGKAGWRFFDRRTREALVASTRTEAELRLALERHELRLHFQPKVGLHDGGRLHGVEALVRWQHPVRGLLMPADFVDLAERCGLMADLGRQVVAMAAAQGRHWLDQGLEIAVAVNVSPSQFCDPDFVRTLLAAVRQAGLPPRLLSIEITESMAMTDVDENVVRLGELRAAGVRVALDDFGIGFSNLSQLSRLPLDMLKVDRSLVQGLGRNGKSGAIIRAIVGMAHALGCQAVAEGIETDAELAALRGMGCDCGQGYRFARPMGAEALVDWQRATAAGALAESR